MRLVVASAARHELSIRGARSGHPTQLHDPAGGADPRSTPGARRPSRPRVTALVRGSAAAIPSGTWRPLGPAPIGPPYLAGGGFYGGANSGRITALATIPSGTLGRSRSWPARPAGGSGRLTTAARRGPARSDTAPDLAIGAIAVDPKNPNHLIAGTGEANQCGDCYRGRVGSSSRATVAATWTLQNPGGVFTGKHVAQVAIDPSNSNHQFAATDGGLYVTTNGGTTWAKPTSSTYAAVDGNITAVVINPTTPKTVYIGGGAKTVAKSTNGGIDLGGGQQRGSPLPGRSPLIALAIAKSSPSILYVVSRQREPGGGLQVGQQRRQLDASDRHARTSPGQGYAYGSGSAGAGLVRQRAGGRPDQPQPCARRRDRAGRDHQRRHQLDQRQRRSVLRRRARTRSIPTIMRSRSPPTGPCGSGTTVACSTTRRRPVRSRTPTGTSTSRSSTSGSTWSANTLLAGSQDNSIGARRAAPRCRSGRGCSEATAARAQSRPTTPRREFIEADENLYVTTDAFATTLSEHHPAAAGLHRLAVHAAG